MPSISPGTRAWTSSWPASRWPVVGSSSAGADPVDPGLVLAPTRGRPGAPSLVNPARLRAVLGEGVTAQLAFVDEIEPGLGALCLDLERVFPVGPRPTSSSPRARRAAWVRTSTTPSCWSCSSRARSSGGLHRPDGVSPRRGYVDEGRALQEGRRHPAEDVVLEEGELLFVPQGWWHEPAPVGGRRCT